MARKGCFEVIKMKFTFYHCTDESGKTKLVSEGIEKFLKKNASNTSCKISHEVNNLMDTDVVVTVEFSKRISVNTGINIVSQVIGPKMKRLMYENLTEQMIISVLG